MAINWRNPLSGIFARGSEPQEGPTTRKAKPIIKHVVKSQLFRINQQIDKWRAAVTQAEDVHNPDRTELIRLYNDIINDDHLTATVNQRVTSSTSGAWMIHQQGEDEGDDDLTKAFSGEWLEDLMRLIVESRFYGFSLIQLGDIREKCFQWVDQVPREYVDPIRRGVKKGLHETDESSMLKIDDPKWRNWLILVDNGDLGLFNQASPLVIWKKNALGSWSQFAEIFGLPWRVGKTQVDDEERRSNMFKMLEETGGATYAVIDVDDEIDFIEQSKSDAYNVFDKLLDRVEKGLSKLILGQTMTIEDGSSRSQAEVHERIGGLYTRKDKQLIERVINKEVIPRMIRLGMLPDGVEFAWDQEEALDFEQRLNAIEALRRAGYKISPEKVEELTGIPVEDQEPPTLKQPGEEDLKDSLAKMNDLYTNSLSTHKCEH